MADAIAGNSNSVAQGATQTQAGAGSVGGQSQQAAQSAPTTQQADAVASSSQVNPLNLNIVVRNKSPGDDGPVSQTNTSQAIADATNANAVNQQSAQSQIGGESSGGQSQSVAQSAPTSQTSNADATSTQLAPTNDGISVTLSPAADPNGSGLAGTLIQIWIPTVIGATTSNNTSTATSTATNSSAVTQSAQQTQQASPSAPTHSGGSGQTQVVDQTAPANQSASGPNASSTQSVTQSAVQTQSGGGDGVQLVQQSTEGSPTPRTGGFYTGGWTLAPVLVMPFQSRGEVFGADAAAAGGKSAPRPVRRHWLPRDQPTPLPPQTPVTLGASTGTSGGGSLVAFAALLIPFLLAAPWWARRERLSAVRRLMGVVSRLDRPG
ncbi:MAG: hypothetical protein ACJ74C_06085 [Gaiellaceae bacterium]